MVTHVRSMFSIAAGGAIVLTGLGATPAQSPHELDDYPQAGSATASSNAPCESPATFEGIVVDDAFRETWFEGSEESAPIETGAAPSVSLGELDGFEDIDAWAWSHNAGLVADRLESLLQASGESEIYSSVVIDSEHRRLSLHLKDAPSAQLRQDIIENAGEIPLDLFTDSRLSGDEFVETVAAMTKYLGDDRAQIAYISPDAEYSSVTVGIYSGMNYGTLAEIATGLLHPLEVIVVSVSPCESAGSVRG